VKPEVVTEQPRIPHEHVTWLPCGLTYKSVVSLDWGRDERDEGRWRRLAASYGVASAIVAGLLIVGVAFGGQIKKQVFEEETEVKFVPEKKPDPPPPPPPPPKPVVRAATHAPPPPLGAKVDAPPIEIPKTKPLEGDPSKAVAEGEGDPNGCVGCTGKPGGGGAPPEKAAPPPQEAPAVFRPYQITEVTTPPIAKAKAMPAFPDDARKQGVDMVVVVKFVVTEDGDVEDVKILDGHPALDAAVIEALKRWKFTPGTLDGKNVRVVRKMKFPFHLRTAN
jgi:periplasmic protein TonB